jgi:hypothetical protein
VTVLTPVDSGLAEGTRIPGGMVTSLIPAMARSPVAEFVHQAADVGPRAPGSLSPVKEVVADDQRRV